MKGRKEDRKFGARDEADKLTDALLQDDAFNEDAAYLQRGRPYAKDPDDVVKMRWVNSFKSLAAGKREQIQILGDCNAEMRRRDLEAPVHEVQSDLDLLQKRIREDPMNPGVMKAIADFRKKLRHPDA